MIEAILFFETPVDIYQTTRRHVSAYSTLRINFPVLLKRNLIWTWILLQQRKIPSKQHKQSTYDVNWVAFVQPFLQWKSNKYCIFWMCVCSLRYPVCSGHAPYCHPWSSWSENIFPHYLIRGRILKKIHMKCVFWFSYTFCPNHFSW